jgi:hypothetical protein
MQAMMEEFKQWCGLPSVQGVIDGTRIFISKIIYFPKDYFYHKIRGYSIILILLLIVRKDLKIFCRSFREG